MKRFHVPWDCWCGVSGDPESTVEPFTSWRLHSNAAHGTAITGEQLTAALAKDLVMTGV